VATPDENARLRIGRWLLASRAKAASAAPSSASRPAKRAPPGKRPPATGTRWPRNLLELVVWVIEDPKRTRRVGLLVGILTPVTASCIAGIVYVIQLRPDRWAYVAAASASVIAIAERVRGRQIAGQLRVLAESASSLPIRPQDQPPR
jgi:hypothetical protein